MSLRRYASCLAACMLVGLLAISTSAADEAASLPGLFDIDAAKAGWTRLRQAVDGLAIRYVETIKHPKSSQPPIRISHEFCIYLEQGYARNVRHRLDKPGLTDVEVENPNYAFRARQPENRSPYAMTLYDAVKPGQEYSLDAHGTRFNLGYLIAGYYMEPFNLFEVLNNPDFTLAGAKKAKVNGLDCVEVEWIWRTKAHPEDTKWTATLSPTEDWAIRSCTMLHPQGDTYISIEYQKTADGHFLPLTIAEEHRIPGGAVTTLKEIQFDKPQKCAADLKEFTASAYGLPEPGKGFSGYMLFFAAIACALAIGAIARYRKKA